MSCCSSCKSIDAHFGQKMADRDLARYRRRGPDKTTELLLEELRATGLRDVRLLDVGAGIGVLHHELLGSTIDSATHVEASRAYVAAAQAEDERRGQNGQVEYRVGDVVELAEQLPSAEIVALDRVICCYPDWQRLLTNSAAKALRFYAFSMPHDRWYVRWAVALENLGRRLRGNTFRTFAHPVAAVHRTLLELGFARGSVRRTLSWHVATYERQALEADLSGQPNSQMPREV